jgi:phosphatidylserine decarboxylase
MSAMKKDRMIVVVGKLIIICGALIGSLSMVYYAPGIPPFLKPLLPMKFRWTSEEIMEQINKSKIDKDFLAFFKRDPDRSAPKEKNIVVAPADGTVKVVREVDGNRRVVIYMSLWDVHIQRVPLSGIITEISDSTHQDEDDFKCRGCPQRITKIDTRIGVITVKQVSSGLAKTIVNYLKEGDNVAIGDRLGAILLGSHTVIELPENTRITAKKGDKVYGAETIIARY